MFVVAQTLDWEVTAGSIQLDLEMVDLHARKRTEAYHGRRREEVVVVVVVVARGHYNLTVWAGLARSLEWAGEEAGVAMGQCSL